MEQKPIKLYQAPTKQPVIYYGCPDGYIYVLFTQPYLTFEGKKSEYVIAWHLNYTFDYDAKTVIKRGKTVSPEILDKPPFHFQDIVKRRDVPENLDEWVKAATDRDLNEPQNL